MDFYDSNSDNNNLNNNDGFDDINRNFDYTDDNNCNKNSDSGNQDEVIQYHYNSNVENRYVYTNDEEPQKRYSSYNFDNSIEQSISLDNTEQRSCILLSIVIVVLIFVPFTIFDMTYRTTLHCSQNTGCSYSQYNILKSELKSKSFFKSDIVEFSNNIGRHRNNMFAKRVHFTDSEVLVISNDVYDILYRYKHSPLEKVDYDYTNVDDIYRVVLFSIFGVVFLSKIFFPALLSEARNNNFPNKVYRRW